MRVKNGISAVSARTRYHYSLLSIYVNRKQ